MLEQEGWVAPVEIDFMKASIAMAEPFMRKQREAAAGQLSSLQGLSDAFFIELATVETTELKPFRASVTFEPESTAHCLIKAELKRAMSCCSARTKKPASSSGHLELSLPSHPERPASLRIQSGCRQRRRSLRSAQPPISAVRLPW